MSKPIVGDAPKFLKRHRAKLEALGVGPEQIARLEATLPGAAAYFASRPTNTAVRKAAKDLSQMIDGLVDAASSDDVCDARRAAWALLKMAAAQRNTLDLLGQARALLPWLQNLAHDAQALEHPPEQQKSRGASPALFEMVLNALAVPGSPAVGDVKSDAFEAILRSLGAGNPGEPDALNGSRELAARAKPARGHHDAPGHSPPPRNPFPSIARIVIEAATGCRAPDLRAMNDAFQEWRPGVLASTARLHGHSRSSFR